MEFENQRNLVEFWLSSQNFKEKLENLQQGAVLGEEIQQDAMLIYNRWNIRFVLIENFEKWLKNNQSFILLSISL